VLGDLPDRPAFTLGGQLHLVVTHVGVRGQMPDVGDVDDVTDLMFLPPQRPLHRVGEHISPHVADVLVCVHRRAT